MTTPQPSLEANRQGRLSPQQAQWLAQASPALVGLASGRAFYFARDPLLVGAVLCVLAMHLICKPLGVPRQVPFAIFMLAVVAVVIVRVRRDQARARLVATEAQAGTVVMVSGVLPRLRFAYSEKTGPTNRLYKLLVDGTALQAWGPEAQRAAGLVGQRVRAYYLPQSKFLVGVELE